MMEDLIFPEIFDGRVMAFFTTRSVGAKVEAITGRPIYMPAQTHSDKVIFLKDRLSPHKGDAVVTRRRDVILGVKTADCVPILLFDPAKGVIGAVHAGWRGTATGIIKKTIDVFVSECGSSPADILLAIGPSIGACCYEVDEDVARKVERTTGDGDFVLRAGGKPRVDLQLANMLQARSMGVPERHVSIIEDCTYCNPVQFFSHRREKRSTGRQGGFIGFP